MSATGRQNDDDTPAASAIAARLREADFVRLVAAADGDSLAASGVVARALDSLGRPFQVSVAPLASESERATDADCTIAVGHDVPANVTVSAGATPASETAAAVVRELGVDLAHALALAGAVADGRHADTDVAQAAREVGIERGPGVAIPTADVAEGLAHSTLVDAPFSGDRSAVASRLADLGIASDPDTAPAQRDLDATDRKRLASLVAVETVGKDPPPRASDALERALRPYWGGPFETIGGYADVLDVVAREQPGTGVALALGHAVEETALAVWQSHARRAHDALADATTGRYDGLFVARADSPDAPVTTMARLLYAFRSPEPVTLAVTDGAAAAVSTGPDLDPIVRETVRAVDGTGDVTRQRGFVRFDVDTSAVITAFREAQ